jgi:hypothetical protein
MLAVCLLASAHRRCNSAPTSCMNAICAPDTLNRLHRLLADLILGGASRDLTATRATARSAKHARPSAPP